MTRIYRCSAPGRCGIVGNPSDMYGGTVLSCSIDRRAQVTIQPADALILATNGEEFVVSSPEDIELRGDRFDIARCILDYFRDESLKCRISYRSDVPMKAGLASSTALTVAMLYAILRYMGIERNRYQVAELARYIELNHLRIICGYQDAYMCTFGHLNYLDFRGKEFYLRATEELYGTVERLDEYVPQLPFVLAHTGVTHSSDAVHRPLRERWLEGDREVREGYIEIGRLAREGKRALLAADWQRLGRLMNENHAIQRDLGGSGGANERMLQVALDHGALGAKLAGAGDGGTIIALNPHPEEMIAALRAAGSECVLYPCPVTGVCEDAACAKTPNEPTPASTGP